MEIQVTCGSAEEAAAIARALVEARLVACAQAVPIQSVFVWDGEVQNDDEVLLLLKTRADRFDAIAEFVTEHHSYDLPAITAVTLGGTRAYLAWVDSSLAPPVA